MKTKGLVTRPFFHIGRQGLCYIETMNKENMQPHIVRVLGFLFLFYGIAVLLTLGFAYWFNFFSVIVGSLLIALSYWKESFLGRMKKGVQKTLMGLILLGILWFLVTEVFVIRYALSQPEERADVVILLGAKVNDNGPSVDYKARLDAAVSYLKNNPDSTVIACGGKGEDEPISEALCAENYLRKRGIENRIIREEKSRNTYQNIRNAAIGLGGPSSVAPYYVGNFKVVIISADYHLLRAYWLAKKAGFEDISLMSSRGLVSLMPHYYMREFFAFWKDVFVHFPETRLEFLAPEV